MKKRFLSLLICFSVVFTAFAIVPAQEAEARTLQQVEADLKECEALLSSLQSEKASLEQQIKKIDRDSDLTVEQLKLYITEIEFLETEIALTEETIETFGLKIAEIEANLLIQEENLEYYERMYASIVRYSFIQGDVSIFQLLIESENFTDFLTRIDNINYFLKYTDSVLQSLNQVKNDLEIIRENHRSAQASLDVYRTDLVEKMNAADQKRAELEATATNLGTNSAQLRSKYGNTNSLISQTNTRIAALKKERQEILDADKNHIWPVKLSKGQYRITSGFGWRLDPFGSGRTVWHNGLDIACNYGTQIVATKAGTVTRSEYAGGYGNVVVVYHGNGISTLYAHASSRVAKVGDTVKQGQLLAYVGSTGSSTGNHLHYGYIINGEYVDPVKYLPKSYF